MPDPPPNVSATATDDDITISWDDVDGGTDEYRIYRARSSGVTTSDTLVATVQDDDSASYSYTDTGLLDGEQYFYAVDSANVRTVLEDFEDGDVAEWSSTGDFAATTATTWEGTYAGHLTGRTDARLPLGGISPTEFVWAMRHGSTNGAPGIRVEESGSDLPIIQIGDGSKTNADGNVIYYDGSWQDTGISVSTSTWYLYRLTSIDFGASSFTVEVEDDTGSTVGSASAAFRNSGSSFTDLDVHGEASNTDAYFDLFYYA
jgi:hypothetical protein